MKKILLLVFGIFVIVASCSKNDKQTKTLSYTNKQCINNEIIAFENNNYACTTTAHVDEYLFQKDTVYVFNPGDCGNDMSSKVFSKYCKDLGNIGGFGGNIIINGEDFSSAVFIKTVWNN